MAVAQTESGPSSEVVLDSPAAAVREQHFGYLSYGEALRAMPGYKEAQKVLKN